jgi:dUTP pyrophosphatase
MRRFERVSGNPSVELPKRATKESAGYDLSAAKEIVIDAKQISLVPTGVKATFPTNEVLYIIARSSLPVKFGLMLPNGVGVIDADYYNNPRNEGEIFVMLYNFTEYAVTIPQGERIAQAIFSPFFTVTSEREPEESRLGGFGSTT